MIGWGQTQNAFAEGKRGSRAIIRKFRIVAIFAEGDLTETATSKDYLQVRREGGREMASEAARPRGRAARAGRVDLPREDENR
jgi:hypothetical protein